MFLTRNDIRILLQTQKATFQTYQHCIHTNFVTKFTVRPNHQCTKKLLFESFFIINDLQFTIEVNYHFELCHPGFCAFCQDNWNFRNIQSGANKFKLVNISFLDNGTFTLYLSLECGFILI